MNRITVYIATSLDGYIAREDGGVGWLPAPSGDEDYGYAAFYDTVDALVMGRSTYEQVLAFGEWPYPGKTVYVLSHTRTGQPDEREQFVDATPDPAGHVWLVAGAQAARAYGEAGRIDEWIISFVPVLLGQGIPLFPTRTGQRNLSLQGCRTYPDGLVQMHYRNGG